MLSTETLPAGTYLVGGVALIQDTVADAAINVALSEGGSTFAAGGGYLKTGDTLSIALPMRRIVLGGPEAISLLVQSSDTHATVEAENETLQVSATYITVIKLS